MAEAGRDRGVELMLAFQAGDEAAFDEIVALLSGRVFSLLRRLLGPGEPVEDLAQEAFLRLYRARASYQPRGKLSTFLYRITYNLALNRIRDRSRRPEVGMPTGAEGEAIDLADRRAEAPWAASDRRSWAERIEAALARLPENQRAALVLQHYDGLDLEQIGGILGISAKAVKSLLHRARTRMREILAPYREAEHD
ncbi:MAG: RNA polymerase sigma factor [Planctomycetota bacterium]|nr:MAG: RNA polymerase sigma factor [Planctomycetota bacterium]